MSERTKRLFITNEEERQFDNRSVESLAKALSNHSRPEFDYLNYREALTMLLNMDIPIETAVKSVGATAQTMGSSENTIRKSANEFLQILEKERKNFNKAVEKHTEQKISSRKTFVAEAENKISQLNMEIDRIKSQIEKAKKEMAHAEEQIATTKNNFEKTFNHFYNEIQQDIENIEQNL